MTLSDIFKGIQRVAFAHGYFTHELGHILFCNYFNGYVKNVNWSIMNGHEVKYNGVEPNEITWICYAPLFINSLLAVLISLTVVYLPVFLVSWIVIGFVATSVPSPRDLDEVSRHHRETTLMTDMSERVLPYVYKWHYGYNFAIGILAYVLILLYLSI